MRSFTYSGLEYLLIFRINLLQNQLDSLADLPVRSVILELPSSYLFPCHSFLHYIVFKVRVHAPKACLIILSKGFGECKPYLIFF